MRSLSKGTVSGTDFRGAAALSLGTVNINRNMDTTKPYSGVANSLIGQANVTTDSNAAIILGAGNTVKNSYRDVDTQTLFGSGTIDGQMRAAVPQSGGQVMVMGGGNSVDNAYMTQVTGVGNTVTGSNDAGKEYSADSTQLNYVDGFYTKLENGKNDYIIGAHNTVTGDTTAQNQSNIVFGDNHKLTNTKNNLILGSSDTADDETTVSDVVSIGHNAKVTKEGGVAIGNGSEATTEAGVAGYDPTGATTDTTAAWTSKKAAVSVGTASATRQITGVAAGTNDTNAVNVAQLKKLGDNTVQYDLNTDKGKITLAGKDGTTITNVKSALAGAKDKNGKDATIATATDKDLKNAVNLGDLQKVYNEVSSKASAAHTALTVEGGKAAGTKDDQNKDVYTGDNILLHATTDETTGKVTYDLKLNNDIMIGNKGKDGVSITGPQGEAGKDGIDGKVGISGKDGKDAVSISGKDGVGHIGLTGPKGADGKPGTSIDISVKNGYNEEGTDGKDGINGEKGVDGNDLTRVVYTDKTGEHQIATLEDGLKFKGDDGKEIAKKLNNTLEIIGGADSTKLTEENIGVNKTDDGKLKIQLAQELNGITSIGNQKTENGKTTGGKITFGTDSSVNVNGGKITNVGNGVDKDDSTGKYTVTEQNKTNAANIGDVNNMVKQAVGELSDATKTDLAGKANVDASNLSENDVKSWQKKLGNGKVESGNTGLVTGDTVFKAVDAKANRDGSNLTDKEADSFSEKIARGEVKAGEKRAVSGDAVNKAINKVTGDVNTKLDGKANTSLNNITKDGQTVIKKLSQDAVQVKAGDRIKVDEATDEKTGNKIYTISANNNGTVTKDDGNLISGDTLYKEVHVDKDGTYIKSKDSATGKDMTVAQNLSALDTGLKTTSDLIHTNTARDTIQIGETSTATKIDVSGKDASGKTTGRVITGVVSDVNDPNSAANVGYVNGITAASNEQIYRSGRHPLFQCQP